MAENLQHEGHFDFSGGVNQYPGDLLKADNETDLLENGALDQFGPVRKVFGYTKKGGNVSNGYNILGGIGAVNSAGTRKLIVVANKAAGSDAFTFNASNNTWTAHALSLTSGAQAEFEPFLDGFFMVNFSDATRWNNLTQWYTTTNVTNAAKAKYIKQYLSRIYLAYVVTGGTTYPSRVTYSNLPSGNPLTITWDDSVNYFDVDPEDGDVIKGLNVNANRLLIFKENSLHRYDTNTRYKVPGSPGTVSQRSVRNILGRTLFLHSSGVWAYDGQSSQFISRAIRDIVSGISTKSLSLANAWVNNDHYYLYVGDVSNSAKGISINKCLLDFDIAKNAWSWRSLAHDPLVWFSYQDDRSNTTYNDATITYNSAEKTYNGLMSSDTRYYFGDTNGAIYQFNATNQMSGTNIAFRMRTKSYYLGNPSLYKLLRKIVVYCDHGVQSVVRYKLDDEDWQTLGRLKESVTELEFPSGSRCRKLKLEVVESSGGDPFDYEGHDIYFVPDSLET